MACPQVVGGEDIQIWRVAANILKKQSQTELTRDSPPALGLGRI
jgi:hypothetical protein